MSGDAALPNSKWLGEQLVALEHRISELEGARSAGFTTLSQGAFTVTDGAGIVRARIGLLDDGDYGVEVGDAAGTPINVGGSLFGIAADADSSTHPVSGGADLGVSLPIVTGPSGRVLVFIGAIAWTYNSQVNARVHVDGSVHADSPQATLHSDDATAGVVASVADFNVMELTPGAHTLTMYGNAPIVGSLQVISFARIAAFSL